MYECGAFQTLREPGPAGRSEDEQEENYARLRKPLQTKIFTAELLEEMDAELWALHDALPSLPWLEVVECKKGGAIVLSPLDPA
ncbi:hypothetical protein [Nonomuraea wenchangensis]|uniref:hypothetical protein n=1 Tax=Nonomuraea wenchangensis TaxID=568860 RepID=UPI003326DA65